MQKIKIAYLNEEALNNVFVDVIHAHMSQIVKGGHAVRISEKNAKDKIIGYRECHLADDYVFAHEFVSDVFTKDSISLDEPEGIYLSDRDTNSLTFKWEGYRYHGTRLIQVAKLVKSIDEIAEDIFGYLNKAKYSLDYSVFMNVLHSTIHKNRVYFRLEVSGVHRDVSLCFNETEHGFSISDPFDSNKVIASFGTDDQPLHHTKFFYHRDLDGVDPFFIVLDKISEHFENKWCSEETTNV